MIEFLSCKGMATDEVKETISDWLHGLAADFYDEEIAKPVQHLDSA
jgi:hypothetical protein